MTTRESPETAGEEDRGKERVRRPEPKRTRPIRAAAGRPEAEDSINESVAHAVKTGYDVIAENIRQGREAAARFREGEYNIRDVPGDLETVLLRLVRLARELSTTTFDVCERLLKEMGSFRPPEGTAAGDVPPFRSPAAASASTATPPPPADTGRMKVTVRFAGGETAVARTDTLERPRRPTRAQDLTTTPLALRSGGAVIPDVTFETDVSVEGLVAVVSLPKALPAGVYSGLVYAKDDEFPLGVLAIEVPG